MVKKGNKKLKKLLSCLLTLALIFTMIPSHFVSAAATGAPGKPTLSHNQYGTDYDGDYDITINMYYGNNATSYKLYEKVGLSDKYTLVAEGSLTDNTPAVQSTVVEIRGRKNTGTYCYYAELSNSYGTSTSDVLEVRVGKDGDTKLLISDVDNEGISYQHTIAQGTVSYTLTNRSNTSPKFSVISSNTSCVEASISDGNVLTLKGISAGRSGLKITDEATGDIRQIGIRVLNADGTVPGMPDYLSIGQVSEDTDNDLNFWKETSNDDTNKRCDVRYIYVNGGPFGGWRSWTTEDGDRVKNYIKESLKLGMIPFFVYYNIPDSGESYDLDIKHINDKSYMEGYFNDLKFFLDICNEYAADETVGMIFEPDFLGYMMQQSNKQPNEITALVDAAYSSGVLTKGSDPDFENSVTGLVNAINYTVRKYYKPAYFGWQFNIWSYDSPEITNQGLLHKTEFAGWEAGREFIKQVATETANYYNAAGITSYDADFISIDKYGLDGAYEDGAVSDPKSSKWLWNADIWNNYLLYTKTLHEVTQKPVILWQIPVGHLNHSEESNPYNGGEFTDLTNAVGNYEDSAPCYFFGDTFTPGAGNRFDYFSTNVANDSKITSNGSTVTWGDHMEETLDAGVVSILFGAGVNSSTDAVGSPAPDNYWWITKAQRYLKNPLKLNGSSSGGNTPSISKPLTPSISVSDTYDTGYYDVIAEIPANSNATSYKIYENGVTVKSGTVGSSAMTATYNIQNKAIGTYIYKVDLINSAGTTSSEIITIKVSNPVGPTIDVPLKGTLTVDKASNDGNFKLNVSIPANSNATSYTVYEDDKIIKTGSVTTAADSFTIDITNKANGTYNYRLDLTNKDATTKGDIVTVTCKSTSTNGVTVEFNITNDWGSGANFALTIINNTNADITNWSLSFDFAKTISYISDADMKANGNNYTLTPKSWNSTIAKGEKLTLTGGCAGDVGNLTLQNIKFNSDSIISEDVEGDINGDGIVDISDLSAVAALYRVKSTDSKYNAKADFNNDGIIDIFDIVYVAKRM